jgi:predicted Zn finger-like uncharacterized protein
MGDTVVAVCPSCSQKYRVSQSKVGERARCRKCGQIFKLLEEPPIDDETIFGWVTEDDPGSNSVLGGTGIFGHSFNESTQVPAQNRWVHPPPPDRPRVEFEQLANDGAYFVFPRDSLHDRALRCSFPHRCAQCLGREALELHYVIWVEKVPARDAALINEADTREHRPLKKLFEQYELNWFNHLPPLPTMPPLYREPFPFAICPQCSVPGAVRGRVFEDGGEEWCRLIIAHPTIAVEFYRNNGGRGTPGYQKLLVASRQRRDNQWKSLAAGVRIRIGEWFTKRSEERFLGYFGDRDFDRTERGTAGIVLTDRRLVYKKYAALREYPLDQPGTLDIEASRVMATIEIIQDGQTASMLTTSPLAASSLARTLTGLHKHWDINVTTHR